MHTLRLLFLVFLLPGCAGMPLPFTDHRLMNFPVETSRKDTNSGCIDLQTLLEVSARLENQHLSFLRSHDPASALTRDSFSEFLGKNCQDRVVSLSTSQIKNELFGDLQSIKDSSKLQLLGGVLFEYRNVYEMGAIEPSLHVQRTQHGPRFRLVAIYRLEDGKVIHYNFAGTTDAARKSRSWPLDDFFGAAVGLAGKAVIP